MCLFVWCFNNFFIFFFVVFIVSLKIMLRIDFDVLYAMFMALIDIGKVFYFIFDKTFTIHLLTYIGKAFDDKARIYDRLYADTSFI